MDFLKRQDEMKVRKYAIELREIPLQEEDFPERLQADDLIEQEKEEDIEIELGITIHIVSRRNITRNDIIEISTSNKHLKTQSFFFCFKYIFYFF
jgi:hypothetical protein